MFRGRRPLNTKKKFCITADYDFHWKFHIQKKPANWSILKIFLHGWPYVYGADFNLNRAPEPREDLFSLSLNVVPVRRAPRWKLGMYFYYYYGYKTCKQTTWLNEFLNHTMLASFEITCDHLNRTSWYRDIEIFFPYKNIYAHIYFYICTYIFLYMYKCL